jgi:hypothetical protein
MSTTTTRDPDYDPTLVGGELIRAYRAAGYTDVTPDGIGTRMFVNGKQGSVVESIADLAGSYMPSRHRLKIALHYLDQGASRTEAMRAAGLDPGDADGDLESTLYATETEIQDVFEYATRPGTIQLTGGSDVVDEMVRVVEEAIQAIRVRRGDAA